MFKAIQLIAENKIQEAMKQGEFDDLPGKGQPLPDDGLDQVPEDLRMAFKLLKNAGYISGERGSDEPAMSLVELLSESPPEAARLKQMQKLGIMLAKVNNGRRTPVSLDKDPDYYRKVVERVPVRAKEGKS